VKCFKSERHPLPYNPQHAEIGSGTMMEQFQKSLMEDRKIDKEEVWSAIRYLDPDEGEKDKEVNTATIIAALAILLIVGGVWVLLLASSKTTVISCTKIGGEISRDQ
jgi:hypothetical protein